MAQVVRIKGLVRLADHVRREIGRGVSAGQRQQLQATVNRAVGQVDAILRERKARASRLAAPSRRAYAFLKAIRWEAVSEPETGAAERPADPSVRLPGLGALMERLMRRLDKATDERELAELSRAVEQSSRRTERTVAREGIAPEQITATSREQRAWFAWMSDPEVFAQYVRAIGMARRALAAAVPNREFGVEFRPIRHIYRMRTRANVSRVQFPTPMVRFDEGGFSDLAQLVFSSDRDAKRRVVERMRGEAYVDAMTELDALGGVTDRTRGASADLGEVFDRVNARYFDGRMKRPRLTWSRTFTRRKFGHYDHVRDWVMVSSTLDQAHVPEFVVDFLMYHELLHKKHGVHWVNGRGLAHTRAFYEDERRFERLAEAEGWLKKLSRE